MADIKIYGTLVNDTTDPKIVNTDQAWDKELGKYQSEINKQNSQNTDTVRTELIERINAEIEGRKSADTALETKITKVTGDIATETRERKAADADLSLRINNEVETRIKDDTTLQTNIDTVQDNLDTFMATKGQANGLASLDAEGKVPTEQLPSYVDDVIEVYATYEGTNPSEFSNIKLYLDSEHTQEIVGESGKIYIDITEGGGYQFRWSGTKFVPIISGGLVIGTTEGTAFDGGIGTRIKNKLDRNPLFTNNISEYIQYLVRTVGIRNKEINQKNKLVLEYTLIDFIEDKFSTDIHIEIPTATPTSYGVMSSADKKTLDELPQQISDEVTAREAGDQAIQEVIDSLPRHLLYDIEMANITSDSVQLIFDTKTKSSAGKWSVEDFTTVVLSKATSTQAGVMTAADRVALDSIPQQIADEATARDAADTTLQNNITTEVNDRKAEVVKLKGLISDEEAARIAADTSITVKLDSHIADRFNPHQVTKAQVGLSNVDNTSDVDKPVSTAQATAIADAKAAGTNAQTDLDAHIKDASNPHHVTRDQLGLGSTAIVDFKKVSAPSGLWKESDKRLKTFIKPLEHTLNEICSIPTDSFLIRGTHDIGTIAQSIEKYFPELVSENIAKPESVPNPEEFEKVEKDGETYILVKEVDYSKMSVLAIEGIKLLKERIEDLEKKLLFTNLD